MGAVIGGRNPAIVCSEDVIKRAAVTSDQFERCCRVQMYEIRRRELVYPNCFKDEDLKHRIVIVVALPVAPASVVDPREAVSDEVVCLEMPDDFNAVGEFYAASIK
ncbi:hypothetical protein [Agrobacterium tumefaciens]|jgi:predicted phosphoribosyltransferase|uniref:hypothetical protein n=1 Tax=Agrobacterium tumefaciens TaxID=358 RepID=UPI001572EF27|nr:hypothetical protein [Agrobacterium tumefaciens]WCK68717.1 hypothetical protein G6L23_025170 [Agrobacterium tumefaciens]